jgi:chromate transporter
MVPTPMVMFSTIVGYIGGSWGGAFLMTLGIFLPAFSFPILGHKLFQRIVNYRPMRFFLDGVTAAVMGLVGPAAAQLLKNLGTLFTPTHSPFLFSIFFDIISFLIRI